LRNQKELDGTFDYLTEEQKNFLLNFWSNFQLRTGGAGDTQAHTDFLQTWKTLPEVYDQFRKTLLDKNQGYTGMVQRLVADRLSGGWLPEQAGHHVFAGFHGLTGCELVLVRKFTQAGATVHWDADHYYMNDERQEAGQFLRELKKDPVLGKTFPESFPEHFRHPSIKKSVTITGVPQKIGQAKLLARELAALGTAKEDRRTVVVVPDESMLLPVLHALPESLGRINVSMGYPIRHTPLFNLLDHALDLQANRRKDWFGHRETLAILAHPYVQTLCGEPARNHTNAIIKGNKIFIPANAFSNDGELLELLFRPVAPASLAAWLRDITALLGASFKNSQAIDREYAYHVHLALNQLCEILAASTTEGAQASDRARTTGLQRLFRQVAASLTIPFAGEPLTGIQVMGALETRAVDFDNVLVLSMNEGFWPSGSRQGSFIPFNIRRAYSLPVTGDQEALSAYVFYRLLQRAKNIRLFHCTESDVMGGGESSRYLHQLMVESGLLIDKQVLSNPIEASGWKPVTIRQNDHSLKWFRERADHPEKFISPSMLNDYLSCRLRFYLNHIARLREGDEVAAELDARIFGNLLHQVMQHFYGSKETENKSIDRAYVETNRKRIPQLIDDAYRELYNLEPNKKIDYEGQHVLVRGILEELAGKITELDTDYAPFTVMRLEHTFTTEWTDPVSGQRLIAGGNIDRVDRKVTEHGEVIRVMDYKTGTDETGFPDISSLFVRDGNRNKAAFQTIFYAWLVAKKDDTDAPIMPGLLNRINLFERDFEFGFSMGTRNNKQKITDARPLLAEFESHLNSVLSEMIHPDTVFDQTTNEKLCDYCGFRNICRR
ncbi:MAG: PD-(D/E)XK nuclease family protein, partial [Bacteroidota bacterium]